MEKPDLSEVPTSDLVGMMLGCGMSNDPSDREFSRFCRDEIAKRKPQSDAAEHQEPKEKT